MMVARHPQVLDCAGGGLAHRGGDLGGTALGDHHPRRSHALRGAADRAEVLGVLHLVERHDQGVASPAGATGTSGTRAGAGADVTAGIDGVTTTTHKQLVRGDVWIAPRLRADPLVGTRAAAPGAPF